MIKSDIIFNNFIKEKKCFNDFYQIISSSDVLTNRAISIIENDPIHIFCIFNWNKTNNGNLYWTMLSIEWSSFCYNPNNILKYYWDEKWFKIFIRLLKNNNAYNSFFKLINPSALIVINSPKYMFTIIFSNLRTKKEADFWLRLNSKWQKIYNEINS